LTFVESRFLLLFRLFYGCASACFFIYYANLERIIYYKIIILLIQK